MKYILTIIILFVTLDCFSQSTQTFFKDSFAIFPQARPISRFHVQGNALITDSLRLTGLPIGNGSDSILSITTSGVVRKTVNGGGGTNTDNWDSVLIRQGSNPFTANHTVDLANHDLTLNNASNLSLNSIDNGTGSTAGFNTSPTGGGDAASLMYGSNANNSTASQITTTGDSAIIVSNYYAASFHRTQENIAPDYIRFTHDSANGVSYPLNTKIIYEHPDTLLTTPEFMYVSDNDTIKKYPFSGGGGTSLFPTAGGSTTLDADVAANLNNKNLSMSNIGVVSIVDPSNNSFEISDNFFRYYGSSADASLFFIAPSSGQIGLQGGSNGTGISIDDNAQTITYAAATNIISDNLTLSTYGSGTHTGTPTYGLSVDASGNVIETSGGGGSGLTRQIITSGSSGTVTGGNYIVTIDPASTLAAYDLTLPASPNDLETVEIDFGGTVTAGTIVTALTISPNSGQTIIDNTPPTSATADNTILYRYRASNTTWYRFKP